MIHIYIYIYIYADIYIYIVRYVYTTCLDSCSAYTTLLHLTGPFTCPWLRPVGVAWRPGTWRPGTASGGEAHRPASPSGHMVHRVFLRTGDRFSGGLKGVFKGFNTKPLKKTHFYVFFLATCSGALLSGFPAKPHSVGSPSWRDPTSTRIESWSTTRGRSDLPAHGPKLAPSHTQG